MASPTTLTQDIVKLRNELAKLRQQHEPDWYDCIEMFMPARWDANMDYIPAASELADSHGRLASETMASGLVSMIFPREENFFTYGQPAGARRSDRTIRWLREKSETVRQLLHESNFFEESQVAARELCVIGTCCLYIDSLREGRLSFKNQPAFSYYIGEDARGRVDTVVRELSYTANQAAGEFGVENLPKKIADEVGTAKGDTSTYTFIHAVMPNRQSATQLRGKPRKQRLAYRDVVVCEKERHTVRDGGVDSFPFAVCRYLKVGNAVWGMGAATIVKGDAFQCETLNQLADVATEKMVWPSKIAPASAFGTIDDRPAGVTYIDSQDPNSSADNFKEWGSGNIRLDIPLKRIEDKHAAIDAAFFVDMFRTFTNRLKTTREMTATEATLVSKESLAQFAPVGSRIQTELMNPIFTRLFSVCYQTPGMFFSETEPVPEDLLAVSNGKTKTMVPSVSYKNKISQQIALKQNGSLRDTIEGTATLVQVQPEVLDNFDTDMIVREYAQNTGIPEHWMRKNDDVKKLRAARAEAQAQQAQLQQAEQASGVAKNMAQAQAAAA